MQADHQSENSQGGHLNEKQWEPLPGPCLLHISFISRAAGLLRRESLQDSLKPLNESKRDLTSF